MRPPNRQLSARARRETATRARPLLRILSVGLEAAERFPCRLERVRLLLAQVSEDGSQRIPQRVDVEAVETGICAGGTVVLTQPRHERGDLLVGPHPRRPALEGTEDLASRPVAVGSILDPPVDMEAVRPVALDPNKREAA